MPHFQTDHECVAYCRDAASGLKAIIAIHSTKLGPALGGTRVLPYGTEEEALKDVLDLSEAMSFKAAAADLPYGGGKAVLIASQDDPRKRDMLRAYARFVNQFGGAFQTGEDLGITQEDVLYMRQFTRLAHCTPTGLPAHLETSSLTARGVLRGIEASLQRVRGSSDVKGVRFAVQGLGKVGMNLARFLAQRGAVLTVSDVRPQVVDQAVRDFGCRAVDPSAVLSEPVDVYSPCAIGRTITPETAGAIRAQLVAGCANNQLSEPAAAEELRRRGILYAPDYVINSGGLISALLEMGIEDEAKMLARVDAIGERLLRIYSQAEKEGVSTLAVIDRDVRARLRA